ncbi:pimeloyl-ACP methyl ester carboxylesterase [Sphingomonas vulcanisoli]|uniref:Pimeloyl-ACP methyl ester carboxylesterase n=1 Tax=Sphingomonas vulcanisoli TaxID=1658060 RepID=A0ABX0TNT6_9SPHN|nr:alpha/beta hydrolase [Sphingomonas vulcanisoli]NIJ06434.1 pimeloyl-ACP methyl ester carboxylesterase [Sphingomonas vulcanisoli]
MIEEAKLEGLGPTSHRFVSQRLALNFVDWGNSDAPLLVLVHGGRDHARNWDWVARRLRHKWHIICPDLRGHGDSAWSPDGSYAMGYYVADLAQLIHQTSDGPICMVGHSLGGAITLRYAGVYPDKVRKLAAMEGLGISPLDHRSTQPVGELWRDWIDERRALSARMARRYATIAEACARMQQENKHLSAEQALHLTVHGVSRNEDGSYSWKFDNYVRSGLPGGVTDDELHELWHTIDCPVWLVHGADSFARHPGEDGRAAFFKQASVTSYEGAGHWMHHDRFESFVTDLEAFLDA